MSRKDDFEHVQDYILAGNVCHDEHSWTFFWDLLKLVGSYEKDVLKGKGEDENSTSCYSTPECFTAGCGAYREPGLSSIFFIGSHF